MLGFLSWTSTQEHPSCIWDLILQNGASCVQHWMYCLVSCCYHCALFPKFDINHVNVQCLAPSPSLSRLHSMFLGARLFESLMASFPVNAQCNLVQFCPQGHFMAAIPAVCWRADLQLWEPTCCCERVPVPPWAMSRGSRLPVPVLTQPLYLWCVFSLGCVLQILNTQQDGQTKPSSAAF